MSFHPLRVAAVDAVADDATCVTLEVPPELREPPGPLKGGYAVSSADLLTCGEPPQLEALPERVVRLRCRAAAGVDVAEPLELGAREHG